MDETGAPSNKLFRSVYSFNFPLSSSSQPKELVDAAEKVWKAEGLDVTEDNAAGVTSSYATGNGFNVYIVVNQDTQEAHVVGSGPCTIAPTPQA